MTDTYPIPAGFARTELRIVNSRFIGSAEYTPTVEKARAFLAHVRSDYPDATHHAYAYLVGHGASVTAGMSDAGEPSGTAGRPMLAVVRGSGLGDITVVVTRFFGGTLLGTGGLVRAYSDTTKAVLDITPRTKWVEMQTMLIQIDYHSYTAVRALLEKCEATSIIEDFAAEITLTVTLPAEYCDACQAMLTSMTAGQAEVVRER